MSCIYVTGRQPQSIGTFDSENKIDSDLHFAKLLAEGITSARELKRLQEQQGEMSHFFSPAVIESISSGIGTSRALIPKEQDISVLFCDVRGFSRVSEKSHRDLHELLDRISNALGLLVHPFLAY